QWFGEPAPDGGSPVRFIPVYKLNDIWIDNISMMMLHLFNTFIVREGEEIGIGSSFGVSQLHGAKEKVRSLVPIHRTDYINGHIEIKLPFIPYPDDNTNIMYKPSLHEDWIYREVKDKNMKDLVLQHKNDQNMYSGYRSFINHQPIIYVGQFEGEEM